MSVEWPHFFTPFGRLRGVPVSRCEPICEGVSNGCSLIDCRGRSIEVPKKQIFFYLFDEINIVRFFSFDRSANDFRVN